MADATTPIQVEATPGGTGDAAGTGEGSAGAEVDSQLEQFMLPEEGEDGTEPEVEGNVAEIEEGDDKAELPKTAKGAKPEEKKDEGKTYVVKIDGQDYEVDEQELIRGYQTGRASQQRFEQAAKIKDNMEQLLQILQKEPLRILLNPALGLDFRKLAEDYLVEQLAIEQMNPEQRRALEVERRAKELEQREQMARRQEQERIEGEMTQHWINELDKAFTTALERGRVPKTPAVAQRMAQIMKQGLANGYDYSADELVDFVRQELLEEQRQLTAGMSPEQLEEYLGKDRMKDVRKADLARVQGKKPSVRDFRPAPRKPAKRYTSEADLRSHLDSVMGRK